MGAAAAEGAAGLFRGERLSWEMIPLYVVFLQLYHSEFKPTARHPDLQT